jgi:opacity protein-like surface antigen
MLALATLLLASSVPSVPYRDLGSELELVPTAALYATAPASDERPGFSYTYVELNYTRMEPDSANEHLDGVELTGSLGLPLGFFVQATDSQLNGNVDLNQLRLGAGWHFALGSTIDAYGLISYVDQNYNSGVSDQDGVTGDLGVKLALTPKIELNGYGEWADVSKSTAGLGLGVRYFLTDRLSLGLRGLFIDTGNEWAAGLRFQF